MNLAMDIWSQSASSFMQPVPKRSHARACWHWRVEFYESLNQLFISSPLNYWYWRTFKNLNLICRISSYWNSGAIHSTNQRPANKPVVTPWRSGISDHDDPVRKHHRMPLRIMWSSIQGTPRDLHGDSGAIIDHSHCVGL